jgi:hypothetical protein
MGFAKLKKIDTGYCKIKRVVVVWLAVDLGGCYYYQIEVLLKRSRGVTAKPSFWEL